MKRKIKVLHMISHMNDGGAQRVVLNYLNDLSIDDDIELKVLVYGDKTNSYCNKIIEKNGFNVEYMFRNIHNKYIRKLIKIFFGKTMLKKYIRKYLPDIVHVHISPFIRVCLNPIIKCNIPIRFDTLHSNPFRFVGRDLKKIRQAFQKEDFVGICVTNEQVIQAQQHYGLKKYEVVHNGVNVDNIKKSIVSSSIARSKLNIPQDRFVVGAIGRLDKIKRFDYLIKIFNELIKKNRNSILLIAGEGTEKVRLKNMIKEYNLEDSIFLLGNIENVVDFYCAIDVLAITSYSESSSLVLIESQICGTRSVISAGTPSESIITKNVKKMEVSSDLEDWSSALLDVNYVGQENQMVEDYDVHKMSYKMKSIYVKYWEEYIDGNK